MRTLTLLSVLLLVAVAIGPAAADHVDRHIDTRTARYVAGSAHGHAAGQHQAVGATDCDGLTADAVGDNAGGACFDVSGTPEGADLMLLAEDDHSPTNVSLFAGFDLDGDGCVGCQPGGDAAWTGVRILGADVVDNGTAFAVFVRALSIEHGQTLLATTGNLTLHVFEDGATECGDGTAHEECGEPFKSDLPYAYGCGADCEG